MGGWQKGILHIIKKSHGTALQRSTYFSSVDSDNGKRSTAKVLAAGNFHEFCSRSLSIQRYVSCWLITISPQSQVSFKKRRPVFWQEASISAVWLALPVQHLVAASWIQKTFDRTVQELSIDVHFNEIWWKIAEIFSISIQTSWKFQLTSRRKLAPEWCAFQWNSCEKWARDLKFTELTRAGRQFRRIPSVSPPFAAKWFLGFNRNMFLIEHFQGYPTASISIIFCPKWAGCW